MKTVGFIDNEEHCNNVAIETTAVRTVLEATAGGLNLDSPNLEAVVMTKEEFKYPEETTPPVEAAMSDSEDIKTHQLQAESIERVGDVAGAVKQAREDPASSGEACAVDERGIGTADPTSGDDDFDEYERWRNEALSSDAARKLPALKQRYLISSPSKHECGPTVSGCHPPLANQWNISRH